MSFKGRLKKFLCRHTWERYDVLVEQLFVGGYYAWQKCPKCEKIKFDSADLSTPEQPGWRERKIQLDEIMKREL